MNTKTLKVVMTVLMTIFTICTVSQVAFATTVPNVPVANPDITPLMPMVGTIIGLIRAASIIAAMILVAVFGFKFIMGSANEKADYLKSFVPLVVGLIVVFASTFIAQFLIKTFTNV